MNIEDRKKYELDVEKIINRMKPGHKNIMYRVLYNEGLRNGDIDDNLYKIKKYEELDKENTTSSTIVDDPIYYPGFV